MHNNITCSHFPFHNKSKLPLWVILLCLTSFYSINCFAKFPSNYYEQATIEELKQAEQLFILLFSKSDLEEAKILAKNLGYTWKENTKNIYLYDNGTSDKNKTGKGDYRFSKTIHNGLALQAPHRYHDKHTGVIVKKLFSQYQVTSIALNSLPRNAPSNDITISADLAHSEKNFHVAYTRAFSHQFPQGNLVQLHGFNASKRTSIIARDTDIIMSTASSWSSNYLFKMQKCLMAQNWISLRYPQQVKELGATRNSIATLMRQLGHVGFAHLELNLSSRETIVNDKDQLKQFADCLMEHVP